MSVYWIDGSSLGIADYNSATGEYTPVAADKQVTVWHNKICDPLPSTNDSTWRTATVDIPDEYENVLLMGILYEMYMLDPGKMSAGGQLFAAYEKKLKDMKRDTARNSKYKTHIIRPVDF